MDDGALSDLAYLARSGTRVRLLSRLADGPATREELREGVARETLRRTLEAFEERGWATEGTRWRATSLGAYVAATVGDCLDDLAAAEGVAEAVRYLPPDARALGLDPYLDAEVVTATQGDPLRPVRRALEPVRDAADLDLVAGAVTQEALAATAAAVDDGQRFRAVFDSSTVAAISGDESLAATARRLLDTDGVQVWTVDEPLGYSAGLADGTVAFGLADERGAPTAYLETDDDRVVEWFTGRFDDLVDAGEPLSPTDFA